ncbi:hypothetical protein PV11_07302 [Exophiala sideris]|uniref:Uncharacterized protein n=1 Tax=Exophiala sideris TaxID=1016849 RepID=A0A0D1Y9V3_9EURO|nr:hypothetical protein PV11_07302 [Exophiala sideris]
MGAVLAIGTIAASAAVLGALGGVGILALDCVTTDGRVCPFDKNPSPNNPENLPALGPVMVYITNGHKEWPKSHGYQKAPMVIFDMEAEPKVEDHKRILYRHYPVEVPNGQLVFEFGRIPTRIQIQPNVTEPLCIAAISVVDSLSRYITLSGNYAAHCGTGWGGSVNKVMGDKDPQCMWMSLYETDGITVHGFVIDTRAESDDKKTVHDPDKYPDALSQLCQPPFINDQKVYYKRDNSTNLEDEIGFQVLDDFPSAATIPHIPLGDRLIKSNLTYNSAVNMCMDQASIGPHFVSHHEKMYCDMTAKRLYPLCEVDTVETCFDDDQDALVERGGAAEFSAASVGSVKATTVKTFEKVDVWE